MVKFLNRFVVKTNRNPWHT